MEVFANPLICLLFSAVVYQVVHEQIEKPACVYRYFESQFILNTSVSYVMSSVNVSHCLMTVFAGRKDISMSRYRLNVTEHMPML